ncbi:MAG: cob(I)yrinic acid a,c-diamide adenosyltransferase [Spirochaetes bacterium]|jgi:cob(I)alamin adenosyltransferase|nr:cob(I)yrinic acid a,c-diamide adenosyltransferase [Spirochaetota bacterium]
MRSKAYVHLYTGHGKGKTTAALGLALRAAGHGMRSIIIQFMKGQHYGELDAVKRLDGLITIEQHGSAAFCMPDDNNVTEHQRLAREALEHAREVLYGGVYPLVVLDEIVTAYLFKLVRLDEIMGLLKGRPAAVELILTGRGAPKELIDACDLVTEMREVKHYFTAGVEGRKGIEY